MTKNDPGVHVFGSVHFYMKELIIIPLKFKMVNGRGPPYWKSFLAVVLFTYVFLASSSGGFRIVSDTLVVEAVETLCYYLLTTW